jgi:hypothetical protein
MIAMLVTLTNLNQSVLTGAEPGDKNEFRLVHLQTRLYELCLHPSLASNSKSVMS